MYLAGEISKQDAVQVVALFLYQGLRATVETEKYKNVQSGGERNWFKVLDRVSSGKTAIVVKVISTIRKK